MTIHTLEECPTPAPCPLTPRVPLDALSHCLRVHLIIMGLLESHGRPLSSALAETTVLLVPAITQDK